MKKLLLLALVVSGWFLVNLQHCNPLLSNKTEKTPVTSYLKSRFNESSFIKRDRHCEVRSSLQCKDCFTSFAMTTFKIACNITEQQSYPIAPVLINAL